MKILCMKITTMARMLSLSLIALVLAVTVLMTGTGSVYLGYAARQVPIYSVDTAEKKVALTFDAAWGADKTSKIIKELTDADVKGTFFLVGFWIEQNKDKVKEIDAAGFDIGTHSNTHPKMSTLSQTEMKKELQISMDMLSEITGKKVRFFRPPFGDYNDSLLAVAGELGLKTIQWDVDTLDWKGLSANQIFERVKDNVKNGSIILCHNNSDHILEALPLIISYLKNEGYKMVKISDLVYENNYYINNNGLQKLK